MVLDLEDDKLSAKIRPLSGEKFRLTLDYPADPVYWKRILDALGGLLHPLYGAPYYPGVEESPE
jgi:hypothetical protein